MILTCPIPVPGEMDACMETILSSVPVPNNWSFRIPSFHNHIYRQKCHLSLRYTVLVFHPFPRFSFNLECVFQLEQVVRLDKDSNETKNPMLQTRCCNVHKIFLQWNNQSFSEILLC